MTRRRYVVATMALAVLLTVARAAPAYQRFVSSAHSFQQSFQDLKNAGTSLNPVERFVFSLVLSGAVPVKPAVVICAPGGRT